MTDMDALRAARDAAEAHYRAACNQLESAKRACSAAEAAWDRANRDYRQATLWASSLGNGPLVI